MAEESAEFVVLWGGREKAANSSGFYWE